MFKALFLITKHSAKKAGVSYAEYLEEMRVGSRGNRGILSEDEKKHFRDEHITWLLAEYIATKGGTQ
jgi:hypothetical protein